jgi:hypothetical protein
LRHRDHWQPFNGSRHDSGVRGLHHYPLGIKRHRHRARQFAQFLFVAFVDLERFFKRNPGDEFPCLRQTWAVRALWQ